MPTVDFSGPWSIVCPSSQPTAALAAAEVQSGLYRLALQRFPILYEAPAKGKAIVLNHASLDSDGFTWRAVPERIDLHGDRPRALLYAAYSLLEALGFRWTAPGPGGERFPRGASFQLPDDLHAECPALPGRCLILGHYAFLRDYEAWIMWAARNRINTLFLHLTDGPVADGAAPRSQWLKVREKAVPLARQRGMTIEIGGHGLPGLLPRTHFKQKPEAFRLHAGKRAADYNFCSSSQAGQAVIRENAAALFRAFPEADVFHVWPDDILGGGWCECDRCRGYTPSEQALIAVNVIAEVLEAANPKAQIAFLAYHDTEAVPTRIAPRKNVCLLWAPRMRCYAHPLTEPACRVNHPHYTDTLRAQVDHFRRAGASPARVFEYYLDAVLFKSVLPPLPAVMQADLLFYQQAGVHTLQALMTGDMPWPSPQINVWLFTRLSWNPNQDLDRLIAEFCDATLGPCADEMSAYYRCLEQAFAGALEIAPEQIALSLGRSAGSLLEDPPTDMGDPAAAPLEILAARCRAARGLADLLAEAGDHLEAAQVQANPQAWKDEKKAFSLTRCWLEFDFARLHLYRAIAAKAPRSEIHRWLEAAERSLDGVYAWGQNHLTDSRFRLNFQFIHMAHWQTRLRWIRGRSLGLPLLGWLTYALSLAKLGAVYRKMHHLYED